MLLEAAGKLRAKIMDPQRRLQALPDLDAPLRIEAGSIRAVRRIARHIVVLECPDPICMSDVICTAAPFTTQDGAEVPAFRVLELRKRYDGIYYDARVVE